MRDWAAFIRERLSADGGPRGAHAEAIDEIAAHLGDAYRSRIDAGATPEDADAYAIDELAGMGPLIAALEKRRGRVVAGAGTSRGGWTSSLGGDIRQALRLVRQRKGVSAIVGLTLAVGIGVCTAVFSVYDAVIVRALPYADPSRLVLLWETDKKDRNQDNSYIVAAPVYEDWRTGNTTLESMGIWENARPNVAGDAEPEQIAGARVSASVFDTLGVKAAIGRTFEPREDLPGHHVAVISNDVWRTQFGSATNVVGRQIRLNDEPYDVVGVMPAGFQFPRAGAGVWVPIAFTPGDRDRGSHSFFVVGRLRPGVTLADADRDMARMGAMAATQYSVNADESAVATSLAEYGMRAIGKTLRAVGGAVLLVLLIACVNVANLQIGLAFARRREFIVRLALGARLTRIARQLLIEGLVLAALGAIGGVFMAWLITSALGQMLGPDFLTFPFRGRVVPAIDAHSLLFVAVAALGCAIAFSFAPLVGLKRAAIAPELQAGSRGVTGPASGLRRWLVAAEVAMAIVVLCGAGLLTKSLVELLRQPAGLNPDGVIAMQVSLPQQDTYGPATRATFCEDIARAAASGPFSAFGAISHLPLSGANAGRSLRIDGWKPATPGSNPNASYRVICPGYFSTLGIPFVAGRDILAADRERVIVVNRVFADTYFPNESALGKHIRLGLDQTAPWMTVVGVVENVKHFGLDAEPRREIFVPYRQYVWPSMTLVAKTSSRITPASQEAIRDVIRSAYPGVPAGRVSTMASVVGDSVRTRSSLMSMLLVFAGVGLLLSAIGVYGVLAYYVSQRRRELGVRVALGASRFAIVRLVLRHSIVPIAFGVGIGLAGSLWTGRLLNDMLFRTTAHDAGVLSVISAVVIAVGIAASWIPAHRAAGVDPTVALRE